MENNIITNPIIAQLENNTTYKNQNISAKNDIDAVSIWLLEFQGNKNTFDSYRQCAERFLLWLTTINKFLKDITREDIAKYQVFLKNPIPNEVWCGKKFPRQDSRWKPFTQGLSSSSIKLQIQILTGLFNYLIDAGYLTKNPFRLIRIKDKTIKNKINEKFLTITEIEYIFSYINNLNEGTSKEKFYKERILFIFKLLYFTGARRSEILNAKMNDFIHKRNQWWFKVIGKGNKYGEIPATQELMNSLLRYRNYLKLNNYPETNEDFPLILNSQFIKNPNIKIGIKKQALHELITNICHKVADNIDNIDSAASFKLRHVSTHWLRHTSATHQVDAGIDIRVVKENLRHSNIETTMHYQHTEEDYRHQETSDKFKLNKK